MKGKYKGITLVCIVVLALVVYIFAKGDVPVSSFVGEYDEASEGLVITFDFVSQSGYASNQFAVWIEDLEGNFVKTLYATRYTANGGYRNRPDSIPTWVKKSNLADMSKSEVDAITSATPRSGTLSYLWDMADKDGVPVPSGEYKFFVEGSLRWKNRVLYSGVVDIGSISTRIELELDRFYEADSNQAALTSNSIENSMLSGVFANFIAPNN